MEDKILKSVAEKEINDWLSFKQVDEITLEENKKQISVLVNAISKGFLTITDDKKLIQKLKFPIGEGAISSIEYRPRITIDDITSHSLDVKPTDSIYLPYLCALTSQTKAVLKALDTTDWGVAAAIVVFFT